MLTLFHVSTLASWSTIAYVSYYGCDNYVGAPYHSLALSQANPDDYDDVSSNYNNDPMMHDDDQQQQQQQQHNPRLLRTRRGTFLGFRCLLDEEVASPITTNIFFSFYILLTSWVISKSPRWCCSFRFCAVRILFATFSSPSSDRPHESN